MAEPLPCQASPGCRLPAPHLPALQGPALAVTQLGLPQRNLRPGRSHRGIPFADSWAREGEFLGVQEAIHGRHNNISNGSSLLLRPAHVCDKELRASHERVASFNPETPPVSITHDTAENTGAPTEGSRAPGSV